MTATATNAATATTWTVDATHAEVGFAVRHLMISTVRGRFGAVEGTVTIDEADPANTRVEVSIDVTSIDTRQEMRDNHLRSPDFFDAATHPKMRFVSRKIAGDINGDFSLIGDLTIRDVTREVTLEASFTGRGRDPWGNDRLGFEAKGKINRNDFGLTWNQALETGGVVVSEEVKLSIEVELVKQQAA
jgi:polyisoprenoid-binding protein YceI